MAALVLHEKTALFPTPTFFDPKFAQNLGDCIKMTAQAPHLRSRQIRARRHKVPRVFGVDKLILVCGRPRCHEQRGPNVVLRKDFGITGLKPFLPFFKIIVLRRALGQTFFPFFLILQRVFQMKELFPIGTDRSHFQMLTIGATEIFFE
ncbi:MAG: hypothetical protein BWY75_02386 [bacterium ADurb.Bin425]|nr:MAG: hypothetical protein BWY75_02386 [bacterium ADurb.Bin425]